MCFQSDSSVSVHRQSAFSILLNTLRSYLPLTFFVSCVEVSPRHRTSNLLLAIFDCVEVEDRRPALKSILEHPAKAGSLFTIEVLCD